MFVFELFSRRFEHECGCDVHTTPHRIFKYDLKFIVYEHIKFVYE